MSHILILFIFCWWYIFSWWDINKIYHVVYVFKQWWGEEYWTGQYNIWHGQDLWTNYRLWRRHSRLLEWNKTLCPLIKILEKKSAFRESCTNVCHDLICSWPPCSLLPRWLQLHCSLLFPFPKVHILHSLLVFPKLYSAKRKIPKRHQMYVPVK